MRTTVTLAPDVAAAVDALRRERHSGVSDAVNELVRRGLRTETAPSDAAVSFRQERHSMGEPRLPLDDVAGLLDLVEGDSHR